MGYGEEGRQAGDGEYPEKGAEIEAKGIRGDGWWD